MEDLQTGDEIVESDAPAQPGSISVTVSVEFDQANKESVEAAAKAIAKTLRPLIPKEDRVKWLNTLAFAKRKAAGV